MRPTVLVIYGGTSSERAVSLRSGDAVMKGLKAAGFDVEGFDYTGNLPTHILQDIVFPVLHGAGGEDGAIQTQLDEKDIRYIGSGVAASRLCFDKAAYRLFVIDKDIPIAAGSLVDASTFAQHPLSNQPYVLKPFDGGSSVDTIIARHPAQVSADTIAACFKRHPTMLLEQLIEGVELTVAVLDDEVLPIVEIIPPADGEFDYENKYNCRTTELCPPLHIDESIQLKAHALAQSIHQACGCRDYSRTDMIVDTEGNLTVLETNTIPGMTNQSLLPKAGLAAGYAFPALVEKLVMDAWARH